MTINLGNNVTGRSFTLNATQDFAGNITVIGGNSNSQFIGSFEKNFNGSIQFNNTGGFAAAKTTLTFKGDVTGNIDFTSGTHTITFGDTNNGSTNFTGNIVGGFSTYSALVPKMDIEFKSQTNTVKGNVSVQYGTTTITFGGNTTTLTGNILSKATYSGKTGENIIKFNSTNTNTISGNIESVAGKNTITFGATSTSGGVQSRANPTNSITGSVIAGGGSNDITVNSSGLSIEKGLIAKTYGSSTNAIKVTSGNLIINEGEADGIKGSIIARNGGGNKNEITIASGNLTTQSGISNSSGTNTITLNNGTASIGGNISNSSGTNTINVSGTLTITGNVSNSSGTNTITIGTASASSSKTGSTNTISGSVTLATSGTNAITVNSGGLSIGKGISVTGYSSAAGKNTIEVKGSDFTLGASDSGYAIYAWNGGNSNSITVDGTSNITGNIEIGGGATSNTLMLNGGGSITGNITAGGGTNNILIKNAATSTPSTPSGGAYTTLDLSATDLITALKSLSSLTGNITTNGGTNNIVFENKIWMPSQVKVSNNIMNLEGISSGTLTTNGGTTNLVLRLDSATNSGVIPVYTVKTTGGTANLVMQGPVNVEADIDYGTSGITNLIFASNNDGKTADEFKNGVAG
ncbi:hypothetical protein CQA57_03655, partial [Helicobacter anseris]